MPRLKKYNLAVELDPLQHPTLARPNDVQVGVFVTFPDHNLIPSVPLLVEFLRDFFANVAREHVEVADRLQKLDLLKSLALMYVSKDAEVVPATNYQEVRIFGAGNGRGSRLACQ